jgi:hypothetical protein
MKRELVDSYQPVAQSRWAKSLMRPRLPRRLARQASHRSRSRESPPGHRDCFSAKN